MLSNALLASKKATYIEVARLLKCSINSVNALYTYISGVMSFEAKLIVSTIQFEPMTHDLFEPMTLCI